MILHPRRRRPPTTGPRPRASSLDPRDQRRQSADELLRSAIQAPEIRRPDSPGLVVTNSPRARHLPGMLRPCGEARSFTVFGQKDAVGLPLKAVESVCEPPPGVEGGRLLRPTRRNDVRLGYGACVAGTGARCTRRLTVTAGPSCERPHWLFHLLSVPEAGGRHRELRLRGASAMRLDGGRTLVLFTKRTTLTVTSGRASRTREAARTLMPNPAGYVPERSRYARPPAPSAAIASAQPQRTTCPA
ncbi:MAG: hypothetical protein AB7G37_04280 [Solirubrobacteraceae bacterium]